MPGPDLSISNSVIQSFLAGQQLAMAKREEAQKILKEKLDREERAAKAAEDTRQFNETFKSQQAHQDAIYKLQQSSNKLAALKVQQDIQDAALKTGQTPGFTPKVISETMSGVAPGSYISQFTPQDPSLGLQPFTSIDPDTFARQQAARENILNEPKTQAAIRIKQAEDFARQQEELQKQGFQEIQNQKNRDKDIEVAKLRAAAAGKDPFKKLEVHRQTPLNTADLEKYHVPAGTTYGQIEGMTPGLKLTPQQRNKIDYLKDMLSDALDARNLLDPEKGGIGYDKYFLGREGVMSIGSGSLTEGLAKLKGESNEIMAAVRNKLGSTFDKRKIESAGKVLSAAELQGLRNYVPPYEHTSNPIQAKVNLNNFIGATSDLINKLEKEYEKQTPTGIKPKLDLNKFIVK